MSQIVDFFEDKCIDIEGRSLLDMQRYDNHEMEAGHSFIQWFFPLHEKSYHAKYSPVLTIEDIEKLQKSETARENMKTNLVRFRDFLGLGEVRKPKRIKFWAHLGNHNLLRITRVIRSLRLFGLDYEAGLFVNDVWDVSEEYSLENTTLRFWEKAYNDDIMASLTDDFLKLKQINIT
jgi:hypothetical protein